MEQNQLDGSQNGGALTQTSAAISQAYPNADPALVERNTLEINADVAKAAQPKLVRHLMQQRIDEAQHEVNRLTEQLNVASPTLLDLPLADAMKIFG